MLAQFAGIAKLNFCVAGNTETFNATPVAVAVAAFEIVIVPAVLDTAVTTVLAGIPEPVIVAPTSILFNVALSVTVTVVEEAVLNTDAVIWFVVICEEANKVAALVSSVTNIVRFGAEAEDLTESDSVLL